MSVSWRRRSESAAGCDSWSTAVVTRGAETNLTPRKQQAHGKYAHAGSRTRVTSMGGLYDAAALHALLEYFSRHTVSASDNTLMAPPHAGRGRGYSDANSCGPLCGGHRQVWSQHSMQRLCWVRAVPDLSHETPLGYVSVA